jgi:hypothetical protein
MLPFDLDANPGPLRMESAFRQAMPQHSRPLEGDRSQSSHLLAAQQQRAALHSHVIETALQRKIVQARRMQGCKCSL